METIRAEFFEIKIKNNKLRIEINNDKIMFILITGISYYKYIKEYNYDEIVKELNLSENKNINNIYNDLIKSEYTIISDEKKIIINDKEIKLNEKMLTNYEIIRILMDEIKNQDEKINELIKNNEDKDDKINKLEYKYNQISDKINELDKYVFRKENIITIENNNKENKEKNLVKLLYRAEEDHNCNIFGKEFVAKNKDNIKLNINGYFTDLKADFDLIQGNNTIIMNIINPIKKFEHMFYNCNCLANIDELYKLDTKYCNSFSYMFNGCSLLKEIKALEKWDVSNCKDFSYMFSRCSSLSDISPLKNWKISNIINETPSSLDFILHNFSYMFYGCSSLRSIGPLEKWNVSNAGNFLKMFEGCKSLSDIKSLKFGMYQVEITFHLCLGDVHLYQIFLH